MKVVHRGAGDAKDLVPLENILKEVQIHSAGRHPDIQLSVWKPVYKWSRLREQAKAAHLAQVPAIA